MAEQEEEAAWRDSYIELLRVNVEARGQLIRVQRLNQTLQNHSNGFRIEGGNKDNANNFIASMHGYSNPTMNPSWIDKDGNNNNEETTFNNNIKTTIKKSNPKTNKYPVRYY